MFLLSQTDRKLSNEKLKVIAGEMCSCMMPSIDTLHPRVKEMVYDALSFGLNSSTASLSKWVEKAPKKAIDSVNRHLLFLHNPDGLPKLFAKCLSFINERYPADNKILIDSTTDNYEKLIETILSDSKCEFLGIIMRLEGIDVSSPRPGEPYVNIKIDKRTYKWDDFLTVPDDSIHIKIYSPGKVDGDEVSVYLNYEIIIENLKITTKPFEKTLCISKEEFNSLVFYAENLGRTAPNTAMLEIKYGNKIKKINVSTDLKNNKAVLITYKKD